MNQRSLSPPFLLLFVVGSLLVTVHAVQAVELADITGVELERVDSRLFSLPSRQTVTVEAVGLRSDRVGGRADAWILDRTTRRPVWQLEEAEVVRRRSRTVLLRDTVELPAGEYELYLTCFPTASSEDQSWFDRIVALIRGDSRWEELSETATELEISLQADEGVAAGVNSPAKVRDAIGGDAAVVMVGVGDDQYLMQAFALSRETELKIYALGEASANSTFDGAWIVDMSSGERLWELDYAGSEEAGGAEKNRLVSTTLRLPAGSYVAHYSSDDSHSWPDFNAAPPYDPMAWGLTIRPAGGAAAGSIKRIEYQDPLDRNVIVRLTGLREDENRVAGFTLKRPMQVRIFAIGEGQRYEMADYGWLVSALDREKVWEMQYQRTMHAGGSEKNLLADERLELAAGSYLVCFVTDGSHSFRDWNSTPPYQQDRWGITVVGVGDDYDQRWVAPYDAENDPAVLARISGARNRDHRTAELRLTADQEVLIYALGEGTDDEMHDLGWIEDSSGRAVWEMSYRMTEHAGGAQKNRLFRGTLLLPAGAYILHYQCDGSHAYRRWNAAPPYDPEAWGIMVVRVER